MRPRRWLLLLASFASLVVLVYAGVSAAFSVPVGDQRAVALPLLDAALVPTLAVGGDLNDGYPGAYLVIADSPGDFPANAVNATLVRALAYVPSGNASTNLTLTGVPTPDGNTTRAQNVTLDANALAGGKAGFFVKADKDSDVRFVDMGHVVGQVARFETPASIGTLALVGALGFVSPLIYLIVTHKGAGKRGMPAGVPSAKGGAVATGACRECSAAMPPGQDFCTRCGAYADPARAPG